jgi:hypothetical protein
LGGEQLRGDAEAFALRGQAGSALLPVMLLMFLFSAIAIGMVVVVRIEISVAVRFVQATQALYAADAAVALALSELKTMSDWTPVLAGAVQSTRSDGVFAGRKFLPGGGSIGICCGSSSVSGRLEEESELSGAVARRTLQWRPYLWSPLAALLPGSSPGSLYVVVFVEDDEDEEDGNGSADVNGRVVVRAEAVQPDGLRRVVEALIEREPGDPLRGLAPAVRLLRWREVR